MSLRIHASSHHPGSTRIQAGQWTEQRIQTERDGSRGRIALAGVTLVTAATFGPYTMLPGVRSEQLVIYLMVPILLVLLPRARIPPHAQAVLAALGALLALALIGTFLPPAGDAVIDRGSALAGADNLLSPIVIILLSVGWASRVAREALLRRVCAVVVWAAAGNALLALLGTVYSIEGFLASFWTQEGAGSASVASRAAALGRVSGIFNQPAEAGLFYSSALLATIYLYRQRPILLAISAALIVLGGALSVSKVFILVGFPIAIWQVICAPAASHKRGRRLGVIGFVLAAGFIAVEVELFAGWSGAQRLGRLLSLEGTTFSSYTAGRFGTTGSVSDGQDIILAASPWFGFGAGGLNLPYDSAWLEALAVAGLAGVVLLVLIVLTLALAWFRQNQYQRSPDTTLGGGLVLLGGLACAGLPAFTTNRASTILWLLITLTILTPTASARPKTPSHRAGEAGAYQVRPRQVGAPPLADSCEMSPQSSSNSRSH